MAKQMQTCMGPLASRGWTWYDVKNKEVRLAGTTGMQSTIHGTTTGSRTGSPTDHHQHQTGVHVLAHTGGVSKIYHTQGVFNRFNGMRARLNQVNSTVF